MKDLKEGLTMETVSITFKSYWSSELKCIYYYYIPNCFLTAWVFPTPNSALLPQALKIS